ncbi:hypothetical protein DFJ63DRAFT_28449 [Scheffersomyces coipomensis]|uniref:uncharacterized protein n=1 Tax=Scheffersomyces coipomensis TaxID=1788519 RepID=UPI00315DDD1A
MSNNNASDDEVEQDVLGNDKKLKQKHRHDLRLNYESDSSVEDYEKEDDEDEEETKANDNDKNDDDDDDDMFASDKEEVEPEPIKKSKKLEVKFLDIEEFEKNEGIGAFDEEKDAFVTDEDMNQSDIDDDEEDDDEQTNNVNSYYTNIEDFDEGDRGQLKKKDPKIEAFDLNDEANEGKFDIDGNFIPNEKHDDENNEEEWINDYKKSDIYKAKKAQEARSKIEQENILKNLSNQRIPIEELLEQLIGLLEPSETPMEALGRLNPKRKRNKSKKTKEDSDADQNRKQNIVTITDLCDKLLYDKLLRDVYDLSKEELMRKYQQETGVSYNDLKRGIKRPHEDEDEDEDEEKVVDYGEKIWEFRWIGDDAIMGPYSNYEMNDWKSNYFENKVIVRKVGDIEFTPVDQVNFEDL